MKESFTVGPQMFQLPYLFIAVASGECKGKSEFSNLIESLPPNSINLLIEKKFVSKRDSDGKGYIYESTESLEQTAKSFAKIANELALYEFAMAII